ncbi:N-acetylmuramoyl-L-alanine amidase family protein [Hippea jasoniae]|uniref:N-acetylmuramoyl-L-alanine amidase family protein n=1 Tax=Hippea jasoniae TaxID=944479 RepID=UPI000A01EF02|nr:N-acetylmuramoyl-L-alanine amidase [Hippea jasoniae]
MRKISMAVAFVFLINLNVLAGSIVHLKTFSIIKLSDNTINLIFRFDKIDKYRFIKLSDDYWYVAIPSKIIAINTPLLPKYDIKKILVRIIRGETRIFFKMDNAYTYNFRFVISKNHHFLIVRISRKTHKEPILNKHQAPALQNKLLPPVIVIDPGHGGKDPGAIGLFNKEKNVVLKIGLYVYKILKSKGYRVYMTRYGDVYPTLADRVVFANKKHATIFVSIHANYAPKDKNKARGLEVYFLNTTSDKRALWLAAKENNMSLSQLDDLNKIILSMIQTTKIKYSKMLASYVYKYMLKDGRLVYRGYKGRGVRQAPFYVLVGTRCPSILIETAFINNPEDALFLRNRRFLYYLAKGIAAGIERFLKVYYQRASLGYDPRIFKNTVSFSTSFKASLSFSSSI